METRTLVVTHGWVAMEKGRRKKKLSGQGGYIFVQHIWRGRERNEKTRVLPLGSKTDCFAMREGAWLLQN